MYARTAKTNAWAWTHFSRTGVSVSARQGARRQHALERLRAIVAPFVGVEPADLVFVRNATEGVNAVLRSLSFEPGDELLTSNHAYPACVNALRFVAQRAGASVRVVEVPFPLESAEQVVAAFRAGIGPRTRLCLVDHVTSATALVFPVAAIAQLMREPGARVARAALRNSVLSTSVPSISSRTACIRGMVGRTAKAAPRAARPACCTRAYSPPLPEAQIACLAAGLVAGKPPGVLLESWLALRFRLGTLPVVLLKPLGLTKVQLLIIVY